MIRPLTEALTFDQAKIEVLSEGKDDKKHLKMKGVFIQGGVKNENKRIYPISEIQSAVENIKTITSRWLESRTFRASV